MIRSYERLTDIRPFHRPSKVVTKFTQSQGKIKSQQAQGPQARKAQSRLTIPKLHLAGETDAIISVESTDELCLMAGSGEMIIHEKGHMFPTKAVYVDQMVEFLQTSLK